MKTLVFFLLLGCGFFTANAQETNVAFKIINQKGDPVPFASVSLRRVVDSSFKVETVTDSTGSASWVLKMGQYLVSVSSVNYDLMEKGITVNSESPVFTITLQQSAALMNTVTVTASRPLIRQEDDKTIIDPESLAASSTNTFEVLEKTPGLFVDQDGNIYINSLTPATVYINGREQKMSRADIATILKSLPPNSILSIEIMRTPSARYDASGSGGIVNVVLKKGVKIGLTGSVHAGFSHGEYGKRQGGFNINNSKGKFSTYLNVNYGFRNNFEEIGSSREFVTDSMLSQVAYTTFPTNSFYTGYGIGYQLNEKWDLNYDGRLHWNRSENSTRNTSTISRIADGSVSDKNEARSVNKSLAIGFNQGLSSRYKIDSLGSEWTSDLSFSYSPSSSEQMFGTQFILPSRSPFSGEGDLKYSSHTLTVQTNLLRKLPHDFTFETGLKSSNLWFENSTEYFYHTSSGPVKDQARTRSYNYVESISAAYLQGSKSYKGFTLKLGGRAENTHMIGRQLVPYDTSFAVNRTDLFPYVFFSRGLPKIKGWEPRVYLIYRKTINRPGYDVLNPSVRYVDPYLLETGNPSLKPQFTTNYEANISVGSRPIFAYGINKVEDIFTNIIVAADSNSKVSVRTYDNLGKNRETYFRGMAAIPPGKVYFFVIGAQYNHNSYDGFYEKKPLQFERGTWSFFTYHTIKFSPLTQMTINGFARFKGQMQFYELGPFGALNVSLNQQFLKKKLSVNISMKDVFYTYNNEFTMNQGSIKASGYGKSDSRRYGVNVRYNFGIKKKEKEDMMDVDMGTK